MCVVKEKEAEFVVAVKKWNMRTVQSLLQEGVVAVDHRFEVCGQRTDM